MFLGVVAFLFALSILHYAVSAAIELGGIRGWTIAITLTLVFFVIPAVVFIHDWRVGNQEIAANKRKASNDDNR